MTVYEGPIIVRNRYLPKKGKLNEVYALRSQASEVRQKIGAKGGQVFQEQDSKGKKYVVWQCEYRSADARKADVKTVKGSAEFEEIKKKMRRLVGDFDRSTIEKTK